MKDLAREKRLEDMRREFAKGLKRRLQDDHNALVAEILLRSSERRRAHQKACSEGPAQDSRPTYGELA